MLLRSRRSRRSLILPICWLILILGAGDPAQAQRPATLQGRVLDPSGAVVPGAAVLIEGASGLSKQTKTGSEGAFEVKGLPPGEYTVTAQAPGFKPAIQQNVALRPGRKLTIDIRLAIELQSQQVVVRGNSLQLDTSPQSNASAVVVSGRNLDALSNDPDELQNQLQALAGPAVGPNGGEIYIDGFTRGDMPPKSAIREIRVNSNPFSVNNDRLGYGRIDIFTKPGATAYHGSVAAEFNDARMNSLSPFLAGAAQPNPKYHTWLADADFGGPAGKNASFFFAVQRRNINRANLVNTDVLDSNLNIVPFVAWVPNPRTLTNVGPRVDLQLTPKNTLTVSYRYFNIGENNSGVDTQSLPSRAYFAARHHHNLQVVDTQTLSPTAVNETRFQYLHFHNSEVPQNFVPTIRVLGAFTGGGDDRGSLERHETHYELQDYLTLTRRRHVLQLGGYVRAIRRSEDANAGFNGTFTFNSLADFQQTEQALRNGQTMTQIQAAGFGPSQFNLTQGRLAADVNRIDGTAFLGDDWSIRPHFTLSYGLRIETENVISERLDWAPRVGIAWGIGHGANVKTVLRAGWGIFYNRFDDDQMIVAERLNGQNQLTYIINKPDFYPALPSPSQLSAGSVSLPTVYRVSPSLHSPYDMDTAVSLERQLTRNATVSFTYLNSRGEQRFLTNDVNAPLPGTFNPSDPASGVRPLGNAAGNIYEYQSAGIFRQTQLITNVHVRAGDRLSLFGYYVFNDAHSDANGVNSFVSNPWNLSQDYGRASYSIRHRVNLGGTTTLPFAIRLSSMLIATSGQPFSIFLPQDLYGTGIRNARPSLATGSTPPSQVVQTSYGSFNSAPSSTEIPIAPNTQTGPANVMVNLQLSRTFGFGGEAGRQHGGEGTAPGTPDHHHEHARGLGGRGLGQGGGFGLSGATKRHYALTLTVSALNVLNTVNLAPPVAVLGSPLFGRSINLAGGPYSAQVGNPVANRVINVGLSLSF